MSAIDGNNIFSSRSTTSSTAPNRQPNHLDHGSFPGEFERYRRSAPVIHGVRCTKKWTRAPGSERSHTTDSHSATSNRSKADQDPSTWLPPNADCRRTYITNWVADRTRYRLTIDPTEQSVLAEVLSPAPNRPSRSPSPANQAVLA
ncbi:hypothetical protein ACFV5G_39715, partial [Streptomyces sp. NPDC059766]